MSDGSPDSPDNVSARIDGVAGFLLPLGVGLLVIFAVFAAITVVILSLGGVVDPRWVATVLVVSGVFGPACTSAGVGLRRRREWARRLTVALVWMGIPVFVMLAAMFRIYESGEMGGSLSRMRYSIAWLILFAALVLAALEIAAMLFAPARLIPHWLRFFNSEEVVAKFHQTRTRT